MKIAFCVLTIVFCAKAGTCLFPDTTPGIKPLPPVGYSDVARACVCDELGFNCQWAWVGTNESGAARPNATDIISGYNPSGSVLRNQERAAELRQMQAQTKLLQEKTKALAAENAARERELRKQERPFAELTKDEQIRALTSIINAARRHHDFMDLVDADDHSELPDAIFAFVSRSPKFGEFLYFFCVNRSAYLRVVALPSDKLLAELLRIESTLP